MLNTHATLHQPVIVIPAYKREKSLLRLLSTIENAEYPHKATLIISLEGGASEDVKRTAHNFNSNKLNVIVIEQKSRLGLKMHILHCADYCFEYGSVILLEDDLIVDKYYYKYASKALLFYANNNMVAGIALYAPEFNESAGLPFRPMHNGYSTYISQIPCSWGQCWTAPQWQLFRQWFKSSEELDVFDTHRIPTSVKNWPDSSWKKYFAAYLVHSNCYFVFPYQSYSSNCADSGGTHVVDGSHIYQVCFASQRRPSPEYNFDPLLDAEVAYDSYLEPCGESIYRNIHKAKEDVEIDTLGVKPLPLLMGKRYALTCRKTSKVLQTFPLSYRPVEQNFSYPTSSIAQGAFFLTEASDVLARYKHKRSLLEYSYYTGFNTESLGFGAQVASIIPISVIKRIKAIFRKKWIRWSSLNG